MHSHSRSYQAFIHWLLILLIFIVHADVSRDADDNKSCDECEQIQIDASRSTNTSQSRFTDPNLHPEHYPFYFGSHTDEAQVCKLDSNCTFKVAIDTSSCWGYEEGCSRDNIPNPDWPVCTDHDVRWAPTFEEYRDLFWNRGDFGYVSEMLDGMKPICSSTNDNHSSLDCSTLIRHCKGRNILLNFTEVEFLPNTGKFSTDAFKKPGVMGGNCDVDKNYLKSQNGHYSELQSWYGELQSFAHVNFTMDDNHCDIILDKPTYFMKLDAGINMYHHFCDFVNLYISQHINNSFSSDVYIISWQMGQYHYGDFFSDTWEAFTGYDILPLHEFQGKRVCAKSVVFSLPPRMRLGFYYNMPVVPHCSGSNMIRAFSQHVLHRLKIKEEKPKRGKVRITILARNSRHRNIINQDELLEALKKNKKYDAKVVVYDWREMSFKEQLKITRNTDVFISMHGAGLTHGFFLPDWGVLFELHNCDDQNCYRDVARLRGVKYLTWEKKDLFKKHNEVPHPTLKVLHGKFCDYSFDVKEFLRLVKNAVYHVTSHPKYRKSMARDEL